VAYVSVPDKEGHGSLSLFSSAALADGMAKTLSVPVSPLCLTDRRQLLRVFSIVQRSVASVSLDPGASPGAARFVWPLDRVIESFASS
jgi:hypothetical protein